MSSYYPDAPLIIIPMNMVINNVNNTTVPTRYRLLLLHFQYTFVFMKENLELKSHYVLSLIRMLQGQHFFVSSQN